MGKGKMGQERQGQWKKQNQKQKENTVKRKKNVAALC